MKIKFNFAQLGPREQRGQTTIEYILLLSVVIGLFTFVLKMGFMQDMFSGNSQFTNGLFRSMQFCYRNAIYGDTAETYPPVYQVPKHLSYATEGDTRFFGPAQAYP
ncbi:MAG: hypothetical protein QE271_00725 [Bacteriovoracaceae bacterium]|nr:hypothetical protein [Bacteriovoracaceae bacterium]